MRLSRLLSFILLVALLATLAPAATAQDWSGRGRLQGKVSTTSGEPVEGAKVQLWYNGEEGQGPESVLTNRKGRWSVLGLRNGNWTVVIEKKDYVPSQGQIRVSELGVNPAVVVELTHIEETEEAKKSREVRGWLAEANEAFQSGNYAEARGLFEQAMEEVAEESRPALRMGIARAYYQEEDWANTQKTLEVVLENDPENIEALRMLASTRGRLGDTEAALATLKQIIAIAPTDVATMKTIINLLLAEGREAEAQPYIDRLPEGETVDPNAYLNLGIEKYNAGDIDAALPYFQRAAEENPDVPEVFYFRGLAYLAKGMNPEARADFERFLEIAPEHEKADEVKEFLSFL